MPLPRTRNVGVLVDWFKKDKPHWPMARVRAAALDTARANGANVALPKGSNQHRKRG